MTFNLPFDLQHWFVNVFAGNANVFIVIAFIVIAMLAGMFRMPNLILGVMIAFFVFIMGSLTGEWAILGIILIGSGVAWLITRMIKT